MALWLQLARVLCRWAEGEQFPLVFDQMEGQGLLANIDHVSPMKALTPLVVTTLHQLYKTDQIDQHKLLLADLLNVLIAISCNK